MQTTALNIASRLRATLDYEDAADVDHVTTRIADEIQQVTGTALDAVTALLASHASTGTDLTTWPGVIDLVVLLYPDIVIEGTGPVTKNTVQPPRGWGETGRYWLLGRTDLPCNHDAAALQPSQFRSTLPTTL